MALGEPLKAAGRFRQAVDEATPGSTEQLEAYYGLLTTFDGRLESADRQIATCLEALQRFPLDAQLLCAMASYLQNQGRLDLACRSYQTAVEHGQVNVRTWHLAELADVATICYSMTLDLQGHADEARGALGGALTSRPESERLQRQLIDLDIKHNRRQEALAGADKLPGALTERNALRNSVRGACLAAAKQWSASLAHLQSAYDSGCRDPICLRWLSAALIATGQLAAAEPVLLHWRAAAPNHPEPSRLLESIQTTRREDGTQRSRTQRYDVPAPVIPRSTVGAGPSSASTAAGTRVY
jgi:tetratricopeptide (TPR) repeat protein